MATSSSEQGSRIGWRGIAGIRQLEVSWGDCDAAGVVFYPRYYAWFDACTHSLLSGVGLDHQTLRRSYGVLGTPLVRASAQFSSPATFGDILSAESWVSRLGSSSFTVQHRFSLGARVVVEGEEVRVWASTDDQTPPTLRAVPMPAEVRALLKG